MSNFSFKRTGQLIKKQWVENRRLYSMSVLALTGILGVTFVLWLSMSGTSYNEESAYIFGLIGLFITGAIFASTTYNMLNAKDTGIYWISFPASHLEKFLVTLFFNVVVFTVVYTALFFVLKFISEAYINYLIENGQRLYSYRRIDWSRSDGFSEAIPVFCYVFFVVQAAFLLGSISFKRFSFIITTIVIIGILFLLGWYAFKIGKIAFGNEYDFNPFRVQSHYENGAYKEYELNASLKACVELFLKFLLAPFLWLVTWFKLKEKQL